MAKSNILVTGGLGFIGQALARRLADSGHHLVLVDNLSPQIHGELPQVDLSALADCDYEVVRGDSRNPRAFAHYLAEADYLVHFAAETGTAQSMYEVARYNEVNSQGTAAILDWLMNNKHRVKKVLLASSRSIYGEGAYRCPTCGVVTPEARGDEALAAHRWEPVCPDCAGPLTLIGTPESARPQPSSIYAATKLAQEDLVRIACAAAGIPWVTLRFQNVYGPGQSLNNPYTGILSIFSTRIRRGLNLPIFEDGLESRDFINVADVANAVALCLESPEATGRVLNVGAGEATSVLDVARMLNASLGGHSEIQVTGQYRLGDIRHCYADITAIQQVTGFAPKVDLEAGLAAFAAWVSSQPLPEDGLDKANKMLVDRGLMK